MNLQLNYIISLSSNSTLHINIIILLNHENKKKNLFKLSFSTKSTQKWTFTFTIFSINKFYIRYYENHSTVKFYIYNFIHRQLNELQHKRTEARIYMSKSKKRKPKTIYKTSNNKNWLSYPEIYCTSHSLFSIHSIDSIYIYI